jgi:hypothetical protein
MRRGRTSVMLTGTSLATMLPMLHALVRMALSWSLAAFVRASTSVSRSFFFLTRSSAGSLAWPHCIGFAMQPSLGRASGSVRRLTFFLVAISFCTPFTCFLNPLTS